MRAFSLIVVVLITITFFSSAATAQFSFSSNGVLAGSEVFNEPIRVVEPPYSVIFGFNVDSVEPGLTFDEFAFNSNTANFGNFTLTTESSGSPASFIAGDLVFQVAPGGRFDLAVDENVLYFATEDVLLPPGYTAGEARFFMDLAIPSPSLEAPTSFNYRDTTSDFNTAVLSLENLTTPSGQVIASSQVQVVLSQIPEPSSCTILLSLACVASLQRRRSS